MMLPQHSYEYRNGRQNDLLEHYDIQRKLGSGTYGVVYQATQKSSGQHVAIKVIRHLDNPLVCRRTLREIKYLQHFKHDNIIGLLDVARPNGIHDFSEACIIQEYMPQNLTQVIGKYELTELQISYLTHQMLVRHPSCRHNPSGREAGQPLGGAQLRTEDMRFWLGSGAGRRRKEKGEYDRVCRYALV
jgi:hypothetical protein